MTEKMNRVCESRGKIAVALGKAVIVMIAFAMDMSETPVEEVRVLTSSNNQFLITFLEIVLSLYHPEILWVFVFFALYMLFRKGNEIVLTKGRSTSRVLSFLFAFFMIAGNSYLRVNSLSSLWFNSAQIIKTILAFGGLSVFFCTIIRVGGGKTGQLPGRRKSGRGQGISVFLPDKAWI